MLNYFIHTIKDILMASIIAGAMTGYTRRVGTKIEKRIMEAGAVLGAICSIVIAVLKNNTKIINNTSLNSAIYTISLCAFLLFVILTIPALRKFKVLWRLRWVALAAFLAALMSYSYPEALMYPHKVLIVEKTALSTDYLMTMIGVFGGAVVSLIGFLASMHCTKRLSEMESGIQMFAQMIVHAVIMLSGILSVNLQNGNIKSNHTVFSFVVFVKNHNNWFIYASLLIAAAGAVLLAVRSLHVNEPYRNPAEHRKIRAKWRSTRRWAATALCVALCGVLTLTVLETVNSREVALSPIEETEFDDENVYVSFESVSDGHLHRFAYETENGVTIRFIVIKKPNSQTYGIGLDACDICGETGYYEKDGQVVCKLCDVVMNISTIGFKGGCNPIVIPYEIKNGQIIVPISGLVAYEKEFK
ncbi:MAG: DUF2318 domain-containing protein [Lachnospiraceae bacterium]|nr:DUF2318 domain-containing protein [Lachnospiraceae bacterium]